MVYEAELLFPVTNEKGEEVVFGSVGGGGRYDGLVSRFRGEPVPATGFSIGVSRLMTALKNLGKISTDTPQGPVVVCVMDRDIDALAAYQKMVQELRRRASARRCSRAIPSSSASSCNMPIAATRRCASFRAPTSASSGNRPDQRHDRRQARGGGHRNQRRIQSRAPRPICRASGSPHR